MEWDATEFFDWFRSRDEAFRGRPWLVLGKGPSLERLQDFDTTPYLAFGLNHVVRFHRLCVSHAADIEVVMECADAIESNAECLAMPWIPNQNNRPGTRTLADWARSLPVLARLGQQGRLLWYNRIGCTPRGDSPVVPVRYFSAEAAYALLGRAGVRTVRSLGVDGGSLYATSFGNAPRVFGNGRRSFDAQSDQIASSIRAHGLCAGPLDHDVPARIYVAATEEQMLSVKVLEYSIRKHASLSVEVVPMQRCQREIPMPRDPANRPRTPFSFQRFLIPELAGYAGRGIYLDSDMLVMGDIAELWKASMGEAELLSATPRDGDIRRPQFSVMVLDCGALRWNVDEIVQSLDEGRYSYEDLMQGMVVAKYLAAIPHTWNSLERYVPGETKLVHFTDMHTQPWIHALHPLGDVWVRELLEGIDEGAISASMVQDHIAKGWVRPSLDHQVRRRVPDPFLLPRRVLALDRGFSPPYRKLAGVCPPPASFAVRYLLGLSREAWRVTRPVAIRQYRRVRRLVSR